MLARLERSWQLVKASASVVRDNPSLLLFPVLSVVAAGMVVVSFALPLAGSAWVSDRPEPDDSLLYLWVFLLYIALYFVTFFFNTALVGVVLLQFEGGDARLRDGLRVASVRALRILGYAVLAATVGLVLRSLEERVGWIGRIVVAVLGTAWTVTTFLVVPVLVTRDVSPIEAVTESARLLKQTWGENLIGNFGIGATFGLAYILLCVGAAAGAIAFGSAGLGVAAVGVVLMAALFGVVLFVLQNALQAVYAAALYRHVAGATAVPGFPSDLLSRAFVTKSRR